jgi:hypothetical protein
MSFVGQVPSCTRQQGAAGSPQKAAAAVDVGLGDEAAGWKRGRRMLSCRARIRARPVHGKGTSHLNRILTTNNGPLSAPFRGRRALRKRYVQRTLASRFPTLRSTASLQSEPGATAQARQSARARLLARRLWSDRARARATSKAPSSGELCPERCPACHCARIWLRRLAAHETKDRVNGQIRGRSFQGGGGSGGCR